MAYEYDFREAKPAGDHAEDGVHCHVVRHKSCITCRMDPMKGSLYCEHCDAILNRPRANPMRPAEDLARQTERLAISTTNITAATTGTAVDAARMAVRAPLALTTGTVGALSELAVGAEKYIARTAMSEEQQAKEIFRYISTHHRNGNDEFALEEVAEMTNEIMEPKNYVDRMEMLGVALKNAIASATTALTAPLMGGAEAKETKEAGARADYGHTRLPHEKTKRPAHSSSRASTSAPTPSSVPTHTQAGARTDTDSSCGDCAMCVIKSNIAACTTPSAGARAGESDTEPMHSGDRNAPHYNETEAERAFRLRWEIPASNAMPVNAGCAQTTAQARPDTSSIVGKYRRAAPAKTARNPLSGTGFTYRCYNCSSTVFEAPDCKSCGVKVPAVYVEDALNATGSSSGAQYGESILDGITSLNTIFGL